jgi:hypothetical protein
VYAGSGPGGPRRELVAPFRGSPRVALLGHETVRPEDQERRAGQRLDRAVPRSDNPPPVDGRALAVHQRRAEPALRSRLVAEDPRCVFAWTLVVAERMRVEDRISRVQGVDRLDVRGGPGVRPDRDPALGGSTGVYFATSIARLSRITITFT